MDEPDNELYDAEIWDRQRNPWVLFIYWLLGLFYFAGSIGGVWYLCHRIDQWM